MAQAGGTKKSKKGRQNSHNNSTGKYKRQELRTALNKIHAKARRERWLKKRQEKI